MGFYFNTVIGNVYSRIIRMQPNNFFGNITLFQPINGIINDIHKYGIECRTKSVYFSTCKPVSMFKSYIVSFKARLEQIY